MFVVPLISNRRIQNEAFLQRKVISSDFKQKETTLEIEIGACIGAMPSNWFILFQKF